MGAAGTPIFFFFSYRRRRRRQMGADGTLNATPKVPFPRRAGILRVSLIGKSPSILLHISVPTFFSPHISCPISCISSDFIFGSPGFDYLFASSNFSFPDVCFAWGPLYDTQISFRNHSAHSVVVQEVLLKFCPVMNRFRMVWWKNLRLPSHTFSSIYS